MRARAVPRRTIAGQAPAVVRRWLDQARVPASYIGRRWNAREGRPVAREAEPVAGPELVRARLDELAEARGELRRALDRVDDRAVRHLPVERMQAEPEADGDAEVRAST